MKYTAILRVRLMATAVLCSALLLGMGAAYASRGADYFPNAVLTDQDGKTHRFYDDVIKGKVVAINFMYTSCGDTCPLETAKLLQVKHLLGDHVGKNVHLYSITVDPERDTPAVLKEYMEKFQVGENWTFLTGKKEDLDLIRKKLGMFSKDETELSDHAVSFVLGNESTGRWLRRTPFDVPESLVAALLGRLQKRPLIQHSSHARVSQPKFSAALNAFDGEDLFRSRCESCHSIGRGDKLGPDLLGVTQRRERAWLVRWIMEPDVMLKEKDPIAMVLYEKYDKILMPNIRLTQGNAENLVTYIADTSRRVEVMRKQATEKQAHETHQGHEGHANHQGHGDQPTQNDQAPHDNHDIKNDDGGHADHHVHESHQGHDNHANHSSHKDHQDHSDHSGHGG